MVRLDVFYASEPSAETDTRIEAAVGRKCVGGGYGLCDGMRDLEFSLPTRDDAELAAAALRLEMPELRMEIR